MKTDPKPQPAKFGSLLGVGPGEVPVYSSDYASADKAELPNRQAYHSYVDGLFMGYKWQCVEFARRWLYLSKGYVFDDVPMAYDIFRLHSVRVVADGTRLPLRSFRNGARRWPEPGCLLIWDEGGEFDITGHVAIVSEVFKDRIRCIEQNVENSVWPEGQTYSRELRVTVTQDGGYWIDCSYSDAQILGWVMQTADDAFAEPLVEVDPRLFNLELREVPDDGRADACWLDASNPPEAAYLEMMGGAKLVRDDGDRTKYFVMGETAKKELRRATNELHAMFMRATQYALQDDDLLRKFNLPPVLWPRIRQSWENRRNQMITGRFDFAVSEQGVKAYEYNCDSAACHMECGLVQGKWADHFGCTVGHDAGEDLFEDLVGAWQKVGVKGTLHIMRDRDPEEIYHARYMKAAIEAAGLSCKVIRGLSGLGWDDQGCVVDEDGVRIDTVWKTWAWETAIDQLRAECDAEAENLRLHKTIDRRATAPRLIDVLLRPDVMVYEPLWTLIPSNKAILPILAMLYPNHPYLLDTQFALTGDLARNGYVAKPIVGRCGHNICIYDHNNDLIGETVGQFDDRDQIYQQLFRLPVIDGLHVQVSTFSAAGTYAGAGVRVDRSPIITTLSDLPALRIVEDKELAGG
ncbi:bifunctional glutathionylspermidine amidase/synthase [Shumkonia mesophila]|uniref:bifunctional glutathionylspermidine amidase/synthase n=1 Tax=Shumkonia mesophila TaxID=2838854 RepID=UPI0029352EE2|nr:bifunctional glutathionylspermidine amidase/synthase [Shumkonia mesophila]